MADIKKWCQPEPTKKAVYEGIYPAVISIAKTFEKEVEKNGVKVKREITALTFKTLADVPFPDKTSGQIILENSYYFHVNFHVNALNGIANAVGVKELTDTDQLEGKTVMIGITNSYYTPSDGEEVITPQLGDNTPGGIFYYAPITPDSKIEFIASDYPEQTLTEEIYKEWFKTKLAAYKSPK